MKFFKITKDTLSTVTGLVGAALLQAGTYYVTGGFTPEAAIAGAAIGVGGYLHNRGNKEEVK